MTIPTAISRQLTKTQRAAAKQVRNKERAEYNKAHNLKVAAEKQAGKDKRNPLLTPENRLIAAQELVLAKVAAHTAAPTRDTQTAIDEAMAFVEKITQEIANAPMVAAAKQAANEARIAKREENRRKQIAHQLANKAAQPARKGSTPTTGEPSVKNKKKYKAPTLSAEELAAKQALDAASVKRARELRVAKELAKIEKRQLRLLREKKQLLQYATAA